MQWIMYSLAEVQLPAYISYIVMFRHSWPSWFKLLSFLYTSVIRLVKAIRISEEKVELLVLDLSKNISTQ